MPDSTIFPLYSKVSVLNNNKYDPAGRLGKLMISLPFSEADNSLV